MCGGGGFLEASGLDSALGLELELELVLELELYLAWFDCAFEAELGHWMGPG